MKIQLKRSNVLDGGAAKEPTASQMEYGELAVNYSEADPAIFIKDSTDNIIRIAGAGANGDTELPESGGDPHQPGTTDDRYVELTGDNMTGDLTLGTDKITLDAAGGSATFAGNVSLTGDNNAFQVGDLGVGANSAGGILIRRRILAGNAAATGNEMVIYNSKETEAAFKIQCAPDDLTAKEDKVVLNNNGSATFTGKILADNSATVENTTLIEARNGNNATATDSKFLVKGSGVYIGEDVNRSSLAGANITLNADGSASFRGSKVELTGETWDRSIDQNQSMVSSGAFYAKRTASTDPIFRGFLGTNPGDSSDHTFEVTADGTTKIGGTLPASPNISLGADGGASFASGACSIKNIGHIVVDRKAAADNILIGRLNGASTSFINANGSASFGGGACTVGSNGAITSLVDDASSQASVFAYRGIISGVPQATLVYKTAGNLEFRAGTTDVKANISGTDGSADFKGIVSVDRAVTGTPANTWSCFVGQNNGTITSQVFADGTASFAGSVNAKKSDDVFIQADVTTNATYPVLRMKGNQVSSVVLYYQQYNTGNVVFSVNGDGGAVFADTVTATVVPPSDARFKENITPANPQLADVVALGGLLKNYDWNDQAPLSEALRSQRQLGLIAQEAEKVCPSLVKTIKRTKQGAVITPEEIIPAVYEEKVIPAEYETVVTPAKLGPKGREITPETTEEVLVTPESTEQVLVTPEQVIPATYEELDDNYKGISQDALIMKLIGAVAELSAEVTALKAANN